VAASPRTKSSNIQQFIYVYAPQTIESVLENAFSSPPPPPPPLFPPLSQWLFELVRGEMV